MLINMVESAKEGNSEDMLFLLQRFMPLLKKYARKLKIEDAEQDLILDFIEFIYTFNLSKLLSTGDGVIVNYISRTVYHCYLKRLKCRFESGPDSISFEDMEENQKGQIGGLITEDAYSFELSLPVNVLTEKELFVLKSIYFFGYSSADIAGFLEVSRQNVNQIKKRAEKKIKAQGGVR